MARDRAVDLARELLAWFPQGFPCLYGLSLSGRKLPDEFQDAIENYPGLSEEGENYVRYLHSPDIWG
jgi:hypothetical protein